MWNILFMIETVFFPEEDSDRILSSTTSENFFDERLSATSITKVSDIPWSTFKFNLVTNIFIFVILTSIYEIASRLLPSVYEGRKHHVSPEQMIVNLTESSNLPFSWIPQILKVSWKQVRKHGGLDAYMFLRYIRMCLVLSTICGFWGMVVLAPVYATAGGAATGWYHISMANVPDGSKLFWITTIYMWLMSIYVLFVMDEELHHFVSIRMDFLAKGDVDVHPFQRYSIMVENIPHELRSDKALFDYFNTLYPNKVHSAHVMLSIPDLEAASRRRQRVVRRLEKSIAIHEATGVRPTHKVGAKRCMCCGVESLPLPYARRHDSTHLDYEDHPQKGSKVDSITYYTHDLEDMNQKVQALQEEKRLLAATGDSSFSASGWLKNSIVGKNDALDDGILGIRKDSTVHFCFSFFKQLLSFFFGGFSFLNSSFDVFVDSVVGATVSSCGFVTFKDLVTLTCSISTPLCTKTDALTITQAPDPNDIQWSNVHMNAIIINSRETTVNLILILGMFFWSLIVASIQVYANLESLAELDYFSWIHNIQLGTFGQMINSYLPVVALLGLMSLLPIIFEQIAVRYEDRKTMSDVDNSILVRYFNYQLVNIFITVTASSLWDSLSTIINDPKNVLVVLGQSVPNVVGYFISVLLTRILASLPLTQLRIGALSRMLFIKCCFREKKMTQRELNFVYKKEMLQYGWEYPMQLFVIVIVFTYACITPIILVFGALCFFAALIVYKKQVLLTYTRIYESGGLFFPTVCSRTLFGLLAGQLTLMGYMIIRHAFMQTLGLFPLPFLTFYMINVFKQNFDRANQLTVDIAAELDTETSIDKIVATHGIGVNTESSSYEENLMLGESKTSITDAYPYKQLVLTEPKVSPIPYRVNPASSFRSIATSSRIGSRAGSISSIDHNQQSSGSGRILQSQGMSSANTGSSLFHSYRMNDDIQSDKIV